MAMPIQTMLLSDLPTGFRFDPTDQELVEFYLQTRVAGHPCVVPVAAEVDIYKHNPWELPSMALFGDREWYFFSPRDRKYPNGLRPNRTAAAGFWKATGTDKLISLAHAQPAVAVKKALVFYVGRPPTGTKTPWIMHEYRLLPATSSASTRLDEWVLCRIYSKQQIAPPPSPGMCPQHLMMPPPPASMIHNSNSSQLGINNNNYYYGDASADMYNSGALLAGIPEEGSECDLTSGKGQGEAVSEMTGAGEFSAAEAMVVSSGASSGDTTAATNHVSDAVSEQQIDSMEDVLFAN